MNIMDIMMHCMRDSFHVQSVLQILSPLCKDDKGNKRIMSSYIVRAMIDAVMGWGNDKRTLPVLNSMFGERGKSIEF